MKTVGKILWWDKHDQNGIIVDAAGNEYYFDVSVIEKQSPAPSSGMVVQFQRNDSISKVLCAKSVIVPPKKSKHRLEQEFERNLQLSLPV